MNQVNLPPSTSNSGPPPELNVDETKPVTTLQLRLADGTRYVVFPFSNAYCFILGSVTNDHFVLHDTKTLGNSFMEFIKLGKIKLISNRMLCP